MKKVLVTGFDPLGGESINPATESVKQLPDELLGVQIIKREIPTVFDRSLDVLYTLLDEEQPDAVICVGQAGGRPNITVERVAINQDDARIPDNEGAQPIDRTIFEDGPAAYLSTLPIKAMVRDMKAAFVPAAVSNTAGTFVCNHVMYGVLYLVDKKYPNIRAGFIHVPYIPAQVIDKPEKPSMSTIDISKGLELAIKAAVENQEDIKAVGGAIC